MAGRAVVFLIEILSTTEGHIIGVDYHGFLTLAWLSLIFFSFSNA